MDSLANVPPEEGSVPLDQVASNGVWNATTQTGDNSTLLYIAVEYVKSGYKIENDMNITPPQTFNNYESHVSPLDPNMSSVARYSPVYSDTTTNPSFNNPVVVHQLVTTENCPQQTDDAFADSSVALDSSRYLQMMGDGEISANSPPTDGLQLVPDAEQEVELLITDQATGISYSVSTQEFLVERCLEDQQLLDALVPGPLLDNELLSLDDNTLKSQLIDNVDQSMTMPALAQTPDLFAAVKTEKDERETLPPRRSKRQTENQEEDGLMQIIYSISDKPFLSRARATLPEGYLIISKQKDEYGVFARKLIPKRTQFGPLEGKIVQVDTTKKEDNSLRFYLTLNGTVTALDTSDENCSNWMRFVKRAKCYSEVNLLLSQQGNHLFYITTKNISPKQELLVDYSPSYAEKNGLTPLKPNYEEENPWPCFECTQRFPTSDELQKHLNLHDDVKNENITRPKKKHIRVRKKIFVRKQLQEQDGNNVVISNNWKCEQCRIYFLMEDLLEIHKLQHDNEYCLEPSTHVCPSCQHKFTTQKQLLAHIYQHAVRKKPTEPHKGYKCTACYKIFATRERIQKHMLVHGSDESKPLQCGTCRKRFLTNSALICHLKTHLIGKKVFECPMCKESFDHVLHLKAHVSVHCENGQYTCPHCNKIFKKYSIIRKHIRAFHCERIHGCDDCGKSFPTLDKLRMHLLRHSDHREFLCADCGKQFKRKDKLREHCKRLHTEETENAIPQKTATPIQQTVKKFTPKVQPTDYHRFIYKCHACMVGFKRRGMLVNHLAKRHPDISPDSVPELNLPILRTTRDYYCQYCDRVYKSSSKRKAHILKHHPGAALPVNSRRQGSYPEVAGLPNPTYSQAVGSITTHPQNCQWCHKQYASKAKLLQHQRKKHGDLLQSKETKMYGIKMDEKRENMAFVEQNQQQDAMLTEQLKRDCFKVSNGELISDMVDLSAVKECTYYQLVSVAGSDNNNYNEVNGTGTSDSRLYRLLTTSSGIPPR